MAKSEEITYVTYNDESQLHIVKQLMQTHLSEPYPIYTYRYFLDTWPTLCILVLSLLITPL